MEDPAWLERLALDERVQLLELTAEVDQQCSVDIYILYVAVGRWDGGLGGELPVIGDLR